MATFCIDDEIQLKGALEKSDDFKLFLESKKFENLYKFNILIR